MASTEVSNGGAADMTLNANLGEKPTNQDDNINSNECSEVSEESSDVNLSRRFQRSRRRGRLHKRQLAEGGDGGGKRMRNNDEQSALGFSDSVMMETDYYFENGLRKVYPYPYTYLCYCKERWKGKTIHQILSEEFLAETPEHHREQIEQGAVKINGKCVSAGFRLSGRNELVSNATHRHELPVTAQPIKVLADTDDYVVIDKPASIPVHPCGRYRHNSITFILCKEMGMKNLRTIYRLDRLTSGLLIFGKNHLATTRMMEDIQQRNVQKTYLCMVDGEFPSGSVDCREPLDKVHEKIGTWRVKAGGKESHSTFERVSYNGETSIVKCMPHTGRTHQLRVHLQYMGYPISNDPLYNDILWGPQKGKGGVYGKSEEQLYQDLVKHHSENLFELPSLEEAKAEDDKSHECETASAVKPSAHDLRLTPDPNCAYCKRRFKDPDPKSLILYLHALSYQGPGWKYETELPLWAKEHDVKHSVDSNDSVPC